MSFYTPAQKRRFAMQRADHVRKLEIANKVNNWRADHPKEWELISQNRGRVPFVDSLFEGLTRWGSLTNRQIHALQNYGPTHLKLPGQ
jgi:hypothetical protein